jgi:hypothetical protein
MASMAPVREIVTDDTNIIVDRDELLRSAERDAAKLGLSVQRAFELLLAGKGRGGYIWDDLSMIYTALQRI